MLPDRPANLRAPRFFSPLLARLGQAVSRALAEKQLRDEKLRAERDRERLLAHEQALAQIGRALVCEVGLERVTEVVIEQSLRTLGVDAVALWLADPARQELSLVAHGLLCPTVAVAFSEIPYDSPLVMALAARTRQIQVVEDLLSHQAEDLQCRRLVGATGLRGAVAVPLVSGACLVGVVAYLTRSPVRFTSSELEFSSAIADLFAVAIEKACLLEDLRNQEQQIRRLLKATIDAQEEERQRICLEIHDGAAQTLVGAVRHLEALRGESAIPSVLAERLRKATDLVRYANREVREVIGTLRPAALDNLGLAATLRHELPDLCRQAHLRLKLELRIDRLSQEVETALYRIVREAISNVSRHARTDQVTVRMRQDDDCVVVEVQDDGCGFDPAIQRDGLRSSGVGLLSMRTRAELLGGVFALMSQPGGGTLLRIEVPLAKTMPGKSSSPGQNTINSRDPYHKRGC